MKFTDDDLVSATTSTTVRPKPTLRINISYSNLHLPIAPPSPLFDGINEDIDTDRFPAFKDPLNIRQSVPAPAPAPVSHCTLHCGHQVCMRLIENVPDYPACQCESEEEEEEEETATSWYRPEMDLDHLVMSCIGDTIANTDPLHEISIYYKEVLKILAHLQDHARSRAPHMEHLRFAMGCDYPEDEGDATLAAIHHIFRILRLYFHRTLRSPDHRSISIQQLQREWNVYLWTLLAEWVEACCDDATRHRVLQEGGPICVTKADSGSSAAVLDFWRDCVEDVLALLVRRDEEVRWCKVESGVMFCVLTMLFLWVLIIILWGNVGSHT